MRVLFSLLILMLLYLIFTLDKNDLLLPNTSHSLGRFVEDQAVVIKDQSVFFIAVAIGLLVIQRNHVRKGSRRC